MVDFGFSPTFFLLSSNMEQSSADFISSCLVQNFPPVLRFLCARHFLSVGCKRKSPGPAHTVPAPFLCRSGAGTYTNWWANRKNGAAPSSAALSSLIGISQSIQQEPSCRLIFLPVAWQSR